MTEGRDRDVCPHCQYIFYRNPVPAVGVVVGYRGGVVLVRRKYAPAVGYWALPAGFMELDESAEDAAARECFEETGLVVQIDHLIGVYSFGEGQQSGLIILYAASAVDGELVAGDDATEAGTFPVDALPAPMAFRTHIQAIERWRRMQATPGGVLTSLLHEQVRLATPADIRDVLALLSGEWGHQTDQIVFADAMLHDWLRDPDRRVLLAQQEGAIAGVALVCFHQNLAGWYATLDQVVVAPVHRRRGLGITLVEAAIAQATQRGCRAIHYLGNQNVESFLLAHGFSGMVLSKRLVGP